MVSVPRRGDCFWANLNPTLGHEQAGLRPVLVVSDDRYNARSRMVQAVPLTSRDKLQPPLALDLGAVGGKQAFALPAQMRALSATRLGRLIESGRVADVERCLDAFLQICGRRPPPARKADNDG